MSSNSDLSTRGELRSGYRSMFIFIMGFALVSSIIAVLAVHSIGDDVVHVYYRVTVPRSCLKLDREFRDIRLGSVVTVFNKSHQLLGSGRLELQTGTKERCEYVSIFTIKLSRDRTYKVGTGIDARGKLTFTDSNLVTLHQGRTLVIVATLK